MNEILNWIWEVKDWISLDVINSPYEALTKGIPWIASAPIFLSIAFLVRVYTKSLMKDMLAFSLVFFMIPWSYYTLVVGINFFFQWGPPQWTFDFARWWIIFTIPFCYVALAPRVWKVILFRVRTHKWPREFPPGPIKGILEDGRSASEYIRTKR
jgi:hypothetical protein